MKINFFLMLKKYRLLYIVFCIFLFTSRGFAQSNISSPYSRYGIGDLSSSGFIQNDALGGAGIGLRSSHGLNIINPASYSAIDTLTFIFEFGIKDKLVLSETASIKEKQHDMNISYLACGFQLAKWWAGSIGLIPYSSVGYKIKELNNDNDFLKEISYNGSGGLNKFYIGNTFKLHKTFSVGFNASYLFGSIEQAKTVKFLDTTSIYLNFLSQNSISVNDYYLNFGMQYSNEINAKYQYTIGAVFDNKSSIAATRSMLVSRFFNQGGSGIVDTIVNTQSEKGTIVLPLNYGIGATLQTPNWLFAADYYHENWTDFRIFNSNDSLANSNACRLGAEFVPDKKALTKYWQKVSYRMGAHFSDTFLKFSSKNEQLKDFGVSFGLGLPVKKTHSLMNVSFEFGQRGTTKKNLMRESYGVISLSFTLSDFWFMKSKFD